MCGESPWEESVVQKRKVDWQSVVDRLNERVPVFEQLVRDFSAAHPEWGGCVIRPTMSRGGFNIWIEVWIVRDSIDKESRVITAGNGLTVTAKRLTDEDRDVPARFFSKKLSATLGDDLRLKAPAAWNIPEERDSIVRMTVIPKDYEAFGKASGST